MHTIGYISLTTSQQGSGTKTACKAASRLEFGHRIAIPIVIPIRPAICDLPATEAAETAQAVPTDRSTTTETAGLHAPQLMHPGLEAVTIFRRVSI